MFSLIINQDEGKGLERSLQVLHGIDSPRDLGPLDQPQLHPRGQGRSPPAWGSGPQRVIFAEQLPNRLRPEGEAQLRRHPRHGGRQPLHPQHR